MEIKKAQESFQNDADRIKIFGNKPRWENAPKKIPIRVFPAHMASGFWKGAFPGGASLEEEQFHNVVSQELLIAVKYWVWTWELVNETWRKPYQSKWRKDGEILVNAMNVSQDIYHFIYLGYGE